MKKLLIYLGAVTMTTASSSAIVACTFVNDELSENKQIDLEAIKSQTEISEIKDLESIEEVNKYLENVNVVGIRSLSAQQYSETDVLVTINPEPNYKLEGENTFIIHNAIAKDRPSFENKFVYLVEIQVHPSFKKIHRRKNTESINQLLSEIKVEGVESIVVIERKNNDAQTAINLLDGYQMSEGEPLLYIWNAYTENPISSIGEEAVTKMHQAQKLLIDAIELPSSDWKTIKNYMIDAYNKIDQALVLGKTAEFPKPELEKLELILLILEAIKNGGMDNDGSLMQASAKTALDRIDLVLKELEQYYGEL